MRTLVVGLALALFSSACAELPTDINTALEEHVRVTVSASASNAYGHPFEIYLDGEKIGPTMGRTPQKFSFHFDVPVPAGRPDNWDANDAVTNAKVVIKDLLLGATTQMQSCPVGGKIKPAIEYRVSSDSTKVGFVNCWY